MLAPRAGHSTVALGKNLFVFGGFTDARNLYDDLHILDLGILIIFLKYLLNFHFMHLV